MEELDRMKIQHFSFVKDKEWRYLCNQAIGTTPSKRTMDYFKVTCKNCKRALDKDKAKALRNEQFAKRGGGD